MNRPLHPTIAAMATRAASEPLPLTMEGLRELALDAGADDVGVVSLDRPEVADQREEILELMPSARTLIAFVVRMNPDAIRSPARSVANLEFHRTGDASNEVAHRIERSLIGLGHRALHPAMGFPMEMDRFPRKAWVIAHKPVAVAAGLGVMGIHRNVIHPRFGNFILLGTVATSAEIAGPDAESRGLDFNPCLECKLCVAACPVGAISPEGRFDFTACYTHNYREFMSGFTDWAEQVADSSSARDYRARVSDSESASMWQSLSFGANYKAAYCLAVCPAGEDVIGPFLRSRKDFVGEVVRPLQKKRETLYVLPNSDAEDYAKKRFPHKDIRRVSNGLRLGAVRDLPFSLPLRFQPSRAEGVSLCVHFSFEEPETSEPYELTVTISGSRLSIREGHHGEAELVVRADARVWVDFVNRDASIGRALLTRKIRVSGGLARLREFGRCFA